MTPQERLELELYRQRDASPKDPGEFSRWFIEHVRLAMVEPAVRTAFATGFSYSQRGILVDSSQAETSIRSIIRGGEPS